MACTDHASPAAASITRRINQSMRGLYGLALDGDGEARRSLESLSVGVGASVLLRALGIPDHAASGDQVRHAAARALRRLRRAVLVRACERLNLSRARGRR